MKESAAVEDSMVAMYLLLAIRKARINCAFKQASVLSSFFLLVLFRCKKEGHNTHIHARVGRGRRSVNRYLEEV